MIEAMLYDRCEEQYVRCHLCLWNCRIAPGKRGVCRTRENVDGTLYTLIGDRISSACLDPIEKKPLYHFHPGTQAYSIGTVGCSFKCPGCQNWQISRGEPLEEDWRLIRMTPEESVRHAIEQGAAGICWTYNDPAIWLEFTLPGAKLAKDAGLYTVYVTNASATHAHLDAIGPYLDAYRVDIKAFSPQAYQKIAGFSNVEGIFDGVEYAKNRWGMHIECVTNVTPTINDSDDELRGIAHWIAESLGVDTPWHVTRFIPYEGFANLPMTPVETLHRAVAIGQEAGLRYVYVGNVPGDPYQDTHCPSCGDVIIERRGMALARNGVKDGRCPHCGTAIYGRFTP